MSAGRFDDYWIFLTIICISVSCSDWLDAQHRAVRSDNFVVYSSSPAFSKKVAVEAERFRKELALEWLGRELPDWREPCPIQVFFEPHAGGETSFGFIRNQLGKSQPFDWQMKIYGQPDRLLDSVLPHEVTHTVFATHYGRPLPRWADEGACTTVEHSSEKQKSNDMLIRFLKTRRGIPFNQMFVMREYPRDILPLYAQGHSVAQFLIQKKGRRHFVDFVGFGMDQESVTRGRATAAWDKAIHDFYGFDDLSDLQVTWVNWVRRGSPKETSTTLAHAEHLNVSTSGERLVNQSTKALNERPATKAAYSTTQSIGTSGKSSSWYNQQSAISDTKLTANSVSEKNNKDYRPGSTGWITSPANQATKAPLGDGVSGARQVSSRPKQSPPLEKAKPTVWR